MAMVKVGLVLFLCYASSFFFVGMKANIEEDKDIGKDLIHNMCMRTDFNDLCVSTLESDPRTDLKSNPRGFIHILIDRATVNATDTYNYIADLVKKPTDKWTIQCLNWCYESYGHGFRVLKNALGLIDFKDYLGYRVLNMNIGSFHSDASNCEWCFTEFIPPHKSPITSRNNYLGNISRIALEIVNLIECNHIEYCQEAIAPTVG
ncbi:hypothetical protein L1049_017014 [Liquidambar formosana]|uniref:Pectinesterase inhibitor domain-containing protein n=1 Tax=Liquidambar formosana TaxID=63359 RepID=A0AAP0S0D9_LIQFO